MNSFTNAERAEVLVQALPHIQHYSGKTIVIKYGGSAMTDAVLKQQVMEDIVLLQHVGVRVVLVHGGGPEISDLMERLGKKAEFIDGLRVTDSETIDIVQMVLAGKINKTLVNMLQLKGCKAMGISGMDGRLIEARQKDERLGWVGTVEKINIQPVTDLLEKGYVPVISTIGCDKRGNLYNINGDTAAAWISGALNAMRLILMTDVPGILRDKSDENSLIPDLTLDEAAALKKEGIIAGGMIPKVECCTTALLKGTRKAIIMDGRVPHAILMELFTNEGAGTMIAPGEKGAEQK